jgi:hypothetical protein
MIKNQYILELKTNKPYVKEGLNNDPDVRKVQEWLNLWKRYDDDWNISVGIDGDFGPKTLSVLCEFQNYHNLEVDGIVGNKTWRKLTEPMRLAFTRISKDLSLNEMIVAYAQNHLKASPREFNQNEGTWVRSYMDGREGSGWPWCMGFVQTIIDQATFTLEKTLLDIMPKTYSCDVAGEHGLKNNLLIRNEKLKKDPLLIAPGDVFLIVKKAHDWIHTGIVTRVENDWIHTIEGNTNDEGSREGYEVCKRKRNFKVNNIDIFKVEIEPEIPLS